MRKLYKTTVLLFAILLLGGCSAAEDIKDTFDALDCANLIDKLNDDNDSDKPCSEIISDINKIENTCNEFLDAETKELLAAIKANCTDN